MRRNVKIILISVLTTAVIGTTIFFGATPIGRQIITGYQYDMEKAEENNYENRKKVEEQCRAYISSYNTDKLIYETYKNSDSDLEKSWAQSARIRANATANTYNEYFLKNSYVFKNNIPADILDSLPLL